MRSCSFRVSSRWQSASLSEETRKTSQSGAKVLETGHTQGPAGATPPPRASSDSTPTVCRALLSTCTHNYKAGLGQMGKQRHRRLHSSPKAP